MLWLACAFLTTVEAGELHLTWNLTPVASGYRVHHGTVPGNYQQTVDLGFTDAADLTLPDCTATYFAVTAYNDGGESGYSPELSSWPRPTFFGVSAAPLERGSERTLTVNGNNFRAGDAVVFSNPGIEVDDVQVNSCGSMTFTLSVAPTAALGLTTFSVAHPSGVTGTYPGSLLVTAPVVPAVLDVQPPDGEVDMPIEVHPTVEFSESIQGASRFNMYLIDEEGFSVGQAPDSPQLSADGTVATIVPVVPLASGTTYHVVVLSWATGIVDLDGHPLADGYGQEQGFTTIGDDQPPVATEPAATAVGGTTAVVEWTTDETVNGEVLFRKVGGKLYLSARGQGARDHTITLTGLEPETEYEFHVRSTDGSGNSTISSPDRPFVTGQSPYAYIRLESEAGLLSPPIDSAADAGVFSGGCIAAGSGGRGTPALPLGLADYSVDLPHAGEWKLWVRVLAPDGSSASWFEAIDGNPLEEVAAAADGGWSWVAGRSYTLGEGRHQIRLAGHEPGARADRLLLTDDPDFLPTEAPDPDGTPPAVTPTSKRSRSGGYGDRRQSTRRR